MSALPPKADINARQIDVLKGHALRSSSAIGRCDRKPLNPAARDGVCQKPAGTHVSEGGVDQLKAVGAVKRYGNGLRHAVKVVIQHSQPGNIARGACEPLPTTGKSYHFSVFEPLDGIAQRVVGGGAYPSGGQML